MLLIRIEWREGSNSPAFLARCSFRLSIEHLVATEILARSCNAHKQSEQALERREMKS